MTRVWGRVHSDPGSSTDARTWQAYETDSSGSDDLPNFIWLQNALLLRLNESPFYADWGIPVQQTLLTQVFPDYYTALTQRRFSQYFASCIISRTSSTSPEYGVSIVTQTGISVNQKLSQAQS